MDTSYKDSFLVFVKQLNLLLRVALHLLFLQLKMNFPQIFFYLIPVHHLDYSWKFGGEE